MPGGGQGAAPPTPRSPDALVRWPDCTDALGALDMDGHPEPSPGSTPLFPRSPSLNRLIIVGRIDPASVAADAIVCPNNERLADRSGLSGEIFRRAGPDLDLECARLEECRTGDAKLAASGLLPCDKVILTVGPRFNIKYKLAAEHALVSCYENVLRLARETGLRSVVIPPLHSERKGYPLHAGSRTAVRAVRQWLDKWGCGQLQALVLAVQTPEQLDVYQEHLRVFFPRDDAEEAVSARMEGVVAERWDGALSGEAEAGPRWPRSAAGGARRPRPIATGDDAGSMPVDGGSGVDGCPCERSIRIGTGPAPSPPGVPGPLSRFGAQRDGAAAMGCGDGGTDSATAVAAPAATAEAAGPMALASDFVSMRVDPDELRLSRLQKQRAARMADDPKFDAEDVARAYGRMLRESLQADLSAEEGLGLCAPGPPDLAGRPTAVLVGARLPPNGPARDRAVLYCLRVLDPLAESDYSIVYVHTRMDPGQGPTFDWVARLYRSLPRKYRKQLRALYVVHPTLTLRLALWALSPLVSATFWHKVVYIDDIAQLTEHFGRRRPVLPAFVERYDRTRDSALAERALSAADRKRFAPVMANSAVRGAWSGRSDPDRDPLLGLPQGQARQPAKSLPTGRLVSAHLAPDNRVEL